MIALDYALPISDIHVHTSFVSQSSIRFLPHGLRTNLLLNLETDITERSFSACIPWKVNVDSPRQLFRVVQISLYCCIDEECLLRLFDPLIREANLLGIV